MDRLHCVKSCTLNDNGSIKPNASTISGNDRHCVIKCIIGEYEHDLGSGDL